MSAAQGIAAVAGTQLAYEVVGTGPCLVLIHGFTLHRRMWDDQIDALSRHFQVVRYDMRGFGHSAVPDTTPYSHAADLKALLGHLNVATATIAGLSMGGGVALDFALSYPEATGALILADAMVEGWTWSSEWNSQVGPVWQAARQEGVAVARERWLALPLFQSTHQKPDVGRRLSQMVLDYSGWHWTHADPQQKLDPPTIDQLGSISVDTLVIVGDQDVPDFQAMATTIAQNIPNSQTAVMPGVGHMANMEDPDQFNALVQRFLADPGSMR